MRSPERVGLHHVERGTGTPVVALHGWTPDHRIMTGCLEPIFERRPGYRRLYTDLPGMGASPAPESVGSTDDVFAAVLDFIDGQVGAGPFAVVGESYGGYLARAIARSRARQVVGMALICPAGVAIEPADRTVLPRTVLRRDPELVASLDPVEAADFADTAVVVSAETLRRFRDDVWPGITAADEVAMARIRRRWTLSVDPESGAPFDRPALIVTGRQDHRVGFADQYALLPHYPRATFAVLDVAGHNAQFEQPRLFESLMDEWLDRVEWDSAPRPAS